MLHYGLLLKVLTGKLQSVVVKAFSLLYTIKTLVFLAKKWQPSACEILVSFIKIFSCTYGLSLGLCGAFETANLPPWFPHSPASLILAIAPSKSYLEEPQFFPLLSLAPGQGSSLVLLASAGDTLV